MIDELTAPLARVPRRAAKVKRDGRVRRFRRQLAMVAPHLDDPRFGPLLGTFARISILALDAYENLRERGIVADDGELRSSVDVVQRLAGAQLKFARELGLTPSAVGKLCNERPIDLAAAMADVTDVEPTSDDGGKKPD